MPAYIAGHLASQVFSSCPETFQLLNPVFCNYTRRALEMHQKSSLSRTVPFSYFHETIKEFRSGSGVRPAAASPSRLRNRITVPYARPAGDSGWQVDFR
jgi:hypothetical protein